jgi:predicted PurR-regulated permease PerM
MNTSKITAVSLLVLTVITSGFVLKITQSVMLPLFVAIMLTYIVSPAINILVKHHVPRFLAIFIVLLILTGFMYLIWQFLYSSGNAFVKEYALYQKKFKEIIADISAGNFFNFHIPSNLIDEINWSSIVSKYFIIWSGSFVSFMGSLFLITIILIFILLEAPVFQKKVGMAFPGITRDRIFKVLETINNDIAKYLVVKTFVSLLTGVTVWFILLLADIDFPVIWGAIVFLLNYIPNIGSIFVVILISFQAFIQFYPSFGRFIVLAVLITAVQFIYGNLLEPKLQGHSLNISPVVILMFLLFWGFLWGPVGMLLSVPIAVAIKIVCENVSFLKSVSILMGNGKDIK